jgi:uncharacterized protein DUF3551
MRMLKAALLGGAIVAAAALMPATPAAAFEYPWCADYSLPGGSTNCGFVTLDQCRATVSGIGGSCRRNLFYAGPPVSRPRR